MGIFGLRSQNPFNKFKNKIKFMARGRPVTIIQEEKPVKYERFFDNHDGVTEVWKYDLNKQPNGPIQVDITYSKENIKESKVKEKKEEQDQSNLPKSKRKYINPINGKECGYTRYTNIMKELNL